MTEDHGVFEEPGVACDHEVAVRLLTCTVCPECEAFTPHVLDLSSCYREIINEIISVQDFGSIDNRYLAALDRAAAYIEHKKSGKV